MSAAVDYDRYRFAVGAAVSGIGYHAVDLGLMSSRRSLTAAGGGAGASGVAAEVFSPCGVRVHVVRKMGAFTSGNRWLEGLRCERCSWVVALNRGTVEQEIDVYAAAAGGDWRSGLLREIFTAILADAAPGPDAQAGHRSDLLAHAARHRGVLRVCPSCAAHGCAATHGAAVTRCPRPVVVCEECSFTTRSWAGKRQGVTTGECVVAAPCSTLLAFAQHYDIAPRSRDQRR